MKVKNLLPILSVLIICVLLFSGCADAVSLEECTDVRPYGFFSGFWHGMIIKFSLIGSLFVENITNYGVNNTGFWYDLGYLLGLGIAIGGTTKVVTKL